MKRLSRNILKEEELAGARQCVVCLCCALITACVMCILIDCEAMPWWGCAVGSGLILLFCILAAAFAYMPYYREEQRERAERLHEYNMLHSDNGSYVDPHH